MRVPDKSKPKLTHGAVKRQVKRSRGGGWAWIAVPLIGAIGLIVLAIWAGSRSNDVLKNVQQFPDQGNFHLSALTQKHDPYNSDPPTSGPHMPSIVQWNFYTTPEPLEYLVHNMEDGGVVVYYRPNVSDAVKQRLKGLQQQRPNAVIVVPGSDSQKEEVILTAWTVMLRQPTYDDQSAKAFIVRYAGIDHHLQGGQG